MEIHGALLVDKPAGVTSHDVVAELRKRLHCRQVGHTGTLDPLATGLMVLVLGEATKLSDFLTAEDKEYELEIQLGVETDTLDRTGQVLKTTEVHVTREQVEAAVKRLAGEFVWPVPLFSAAKIKGKKAYEYGRQGQTVELPRKTMKFMDPVLLDFRGDRLKVRVSCSKGSFVRTWAAELGALLGVGAHVAELRRTRVGLWQVKDAVDLPSLRAKEIKDIRDLGASFIPMASTLPGMKTLMASPKEAKLIANGQIPNDLSGRLVVEQKRALETGHPVLMKVLAPGGDLVGLLTAEPGQGLKIKRVFRSFA